MRGAVLLRIQHPIRVAVIGDVSGVGGGIPNLGPAGATRQANSSAGGLVRVVIFGAKRVCRGLRRGIAVKIPRRGQQHRVVFTAVDQNHFGVCRCVLIEASEVRTRDS